MKRNRIISFVIILLLNILVSSTSSEASIWADALGQENSFIKIAGDNGNMIGLKSDGTIWNWGSGDIVKSVTGIDISTFAPIQIKDLTDVVDIAASSSYSLALKKDGTVWAWGNNSYGQLGINTKVNATKPIKVSNLDGI